LGVDAAHRPAVEHHIPHGRLQVKRVIVGPYRADGRCGADDDAVIPPAYSKRPEPLRSSLTLDHLPAKRGGFHASFARAKRLLTKWGVGRAQQGLRGFAASP
jgi:hypothetical protein